MYVRHGVHVKTRGCMKRRKGLASSSSIMLTIHRFRLDCSKSSIASAASRTRSRPRAMVIEPAAASRGVVAIGRRREPPCSRRLRQHKPFLTSAVAEFVLDDYVRRGDSVKDDLGSVALTPREREIVQLVAEGQSSKEAAAKLSLTVKTVETHRANIMKKLRLRSVSDLVRYAIRNKTVEP
jgi:DNA-binding CsgD family transcriptional regulator